MEARTVLPQTSSEAILKPQTADQILVAAKGVHWAFDDLVRRLTRERQVVLFHLLIKERAVNA